VPIFTPVPFLDFTTPLIVPYWADVDTRYEGAGTVWYRESFNQSDLERAQLEIKEAFPEEAANFRARLVFVATWDHVGYYDKNTTKVCSLLPLC